MKLTHFQAKHPGKYGITLDLFYYSLKQAKKFNPYLTDWVEIGKINKKEVP